MKTKPCWHAEGFGSQRTARTQAHSVQRRMRIDGSSIHPKPTPRRRKGMLRPPRGSPQSRPDARRRYAPMDGSSEERRERSRAPSHASISPTRTTRLVDRPCAGRWIGLVGSCRPSFPVHDGFEPASSFVERVWDGAGYDPPMRSTSRSSLLRGSTRFPVHGRAEGSEG